MAAIPSDTLRRERVINWHGRDQVFKLFWRAQRTHRDKAMRPRRNEIASSASGGVLRTTCFSSRRHHRVIIALKESVCSGKRCGITGDTKIDRASRPRKPRRILASWSHTCDLYWDRLRQGHFSEAINIHYLSLIIRIRRSPTIQKEFDDV